MTATTTKAKRSAKRPAAGHPSKRGIRPPQAKIHSGASTDKSQVDFRSLPLKERRALLDASFGSLSWVNYSVDEYLAEKRSEVDRENRS